MAEQHGKVFWSELMTRDMAAARAFYTQVCGWSWETVPMEDGDYHVASAHGQMVAGAMDMTGMPGMDGMPPHWFTYIAVDDTDAAAAATEAAGGRVIRPPFDVKGVGRIVIVEDAAGAALGLMTPS